MVQGHWDAPYCDMAKGLWPIATSSALHLPSSLSMPRLLVQAGAIARCVLAGCFALNPNMRTVHPELAHALVNRSDEIDLPNQLTLQLALTRGPFARVTGSIGGFYLFRPKVDGKNVGIMSMAQIYFPPLAWQLADASHSVLLQQQGWADVSGWLASDPHDRLVLADLVSNLPLVVHPTRESGGMEDWVELLSDETCFIVESDNAVRSEWMEE
jgi:hypothetical protein